MSSTGDKPGPGGSQTRRVTRNSTPALGLSDTTYMAVMEKIDDVDKAIALLEARELIPGGQQPTLLTIWDGLLHLDRTAAPSAITVECLVAFSKIAGAIDLEHVTSEIATKVCNKTMVAFNILDEGIDKFEETRTALEGCVNRAAEQVRELELYRKNIQETWRRE